MSGTDILNEDTRGVSSVLWFAALELCEMMLPWQPPCDNEAPNPERKNHHDEEGSGALMLELPGPLATQTLSSRSEAPSCNCTHTSGFSSPGRN